MKDKGLNYKSLAAKVGLTNTSIMRYCKGRSFPKSLKVVQDLSAALDVSVKDLLIDENDRFATELLGQASDQDIYNYAFSVYQKFLKKLDQEDLDDETSMVAMQRKKQIEYVMDYQKSMKSVLLRFKPEYYDTYIAPSVAKTGIPLATYIRMALEEKIKRDGLLDKGLEFPPFDIQGSLQRKINR